MSIVLAVTILTLVGLYITPQHHRELLLLPIILLLMIAGMLFILFWQLYREMIKPIGSFRRWASRMRAGDYAAEINVPIEGEFAGFLQEITEMGRWYKEIGLEGDERVSGQIRQMARKTRLLEILYDIAATISVFRDLSDVLLRFLEVIAEITHAQIAVVRLADLDGQMQLTGVIGAKSSDYAKAIPLAKAVPSAQGKIRSVYVVSPEVLPDFAVYASQSVDWVCVVVPLVHQGRVMGCYQLLIDQSVSSMSYDLHELLTSMGFHLGLAVYKAQLDDEAKRQSILRERLTMAHELHDSLAQSMAGLRFRCNAIKESFGQSRPDEALQEITQLTKGVDHANAELRELLTNFRAPLDQYSLITALQNMLKPFQQAGGLKIFSQFDLSDTAVPAVIQRQVVRIAGEAMSNIKKHANANLVRFLLRPLPQGGCQMLIEDNGQGFDPSQPFPKQHVGLKTMRERAALIGADLLVDSERGEGSRIELIFRLDNV